MHSSKRFILEAKLWIVITAFCVVMAILFPNQWNAVGVACVAFVSNYALYLTASGAAEAAKAKESTEV